MGSMPNMWNTTHMPHVEDVLNEIRNRFGWTDYLVFVIMLVICLIIGIYYGFVKVSRTELEYLVGGRNMKVFPIGLSLIASFISGISLLGIPTEIYIYGIQFIYILIGMVLMGFIFQYIYLPVFVELKLTSTFEYLERRFSWGTRVFGSVLCIIGTITWLPVVIYVPALAFNQVTGINIHLVSPIVCLICIFYTSMGGIKAVVWTDVIQTVVMVGTMILIAVKGTVDVGGLGTVIQRNFETGRLEAPDIDPNPLTRHTIWSLVIGGGVYYLQTSAVNQPMIQRYLALPNLKTANKAVWIFAIGIIILVSLSSYCGLLIFATYFDCDPIKTKLAKQKDQLLPILVMDVIGNYPGIPGLFVAGIFSAALSSLSTGLNSLVAIILEDFYRPFFKYDLSERHKQIMMKSTTVILGIIFVALVFVVERLGSVLQLTMSVGTISAGPSLALFTMGMVLPWIETKGALVGSVTGLGCMSWLILRTQIAMNNGQIKFKEKPTFVDNCQYDYYKYRETPKIFQKQEVPYNHNAFNGVPYIYHLSYLWYTLIGLVISCVVGLIFSYLSNKMLDPRDVDPCLLSPFVRKRIKPRSFPNQPPAQDPIILAYDAKEYKITTTIPEYKGITSNI